MCIEIVVVGDYDFVSRVFFVFVSLVLCSFSSHQGAVLVHVLAQQQP